MKSKGLGDTVKWVTDTTGISKAVKYVFGDNCGCKERQDKLNKLVSYGQEVKKLEEQDGQNSNKE